MSVRHYRKDPREAAERRADEKVLQLFSRRKFLAVEPGIERDAVDHVQRRYQARRETVASLGKELGVLRRAHGLTQEQVALALGTQKGNITRIESGQYGGLTIEYFIALLDAFRALGESPVRTRPRRGEVVPVKKAPPKTVQPPSRARR